MTTKKYFSVALLIVAAFAASGCGVFKKGKASTPVLGQRIAVLTGEGDVTVDPATAAMPMSLPQPAVNTDWTQSGGNATKSMGHLAFGNALARVFTVQAGRGSSLSARLAAAPIIANGRVYTIDTLGNRARLRRTHRRRPVVEPDSLRQGKPGLALRRRNRL